MKIFNIRHARERIAELAAQITANGGTPPTNCSNSGSIGESQASIAKLETVLADCRARKASAKPGSVAPLIACMSEKLTGTTAESLTATIRESTANLKTRGAALAAATARLEAIRAENRALVAREKARSAVAALVSKTPHLDRFNELEGPAASHFYSQHGPEIRAELASRNQAEAAISREMHAARASARQIRDLEKLNTKR
jgi:hypothetical protein